MLSKTETVDQHTEASTQIVGTKVKHSEHANCLYVCHRDCLIVLWMKMASLYLRVMSLSHLAHERANFTMSQKQGPKQNKKVPQCAYVLGPLKQLVFHLFVQKWKIIIFWFPKS